MDPISNMLTSIKNAQAVRRATVEIPFSKLKYEIGKILYQEKFIDEIKIKKRIQRRMIEIALKYNNETPAISGIKRVSKPGQRIYKGLSELKSVKRGYGTAIISTSKGLMTDKKARKQKLGGEVICEIW